MLLDRARVAHGNLAGFLRLALADDDGARHGVLTVSLARVIESVRSGRLVASVTRNLLRHRETTRVARVGVGEGGGDRRRANLADRHGLSIMASRVESVTVNAGTCSVLSHLAGGADRELLRARHGGLVTRDIRDVPALLRVVRQGTGVAEAKLLRRSALGTAGVLDHLEAVVGSAHAHRVQQVDRRGRLISDRQARGVSGADGELRILPHVAVRQNGVSRRGLLMQVGDHRARWERYREADRLASRDLHRGSTSAVVTVERAAPRVVDRRRPVRVVGLGGVRRKLVVEGDVKAHSSSHLVDVVRGDLLGDTEGTLTLVHQGTDGSRRNKAHGICRCNRGSVSRNSVGVVGSRKGLPVVAGEESTVGDHVVGLGPERTLHLEGDQSRSVSFRLITLAGDLEGPLVSGLRPWLQTVVQFERLRGILLRVNRVEDDRLQRAFHTRAERILEGDGLFRLTIEGEIERLLERRTTEVEEPCCLRIPFLHDAGVALVDPLIRIVFRLTLDDPTCSGEVDLDGLRSLITVNDER